MSRMMTPEEVRGWAAIFLSALAVVVVAVIGARSAWKNSRKTSEEQAAARREPSWNELVTENRAQRTEMDTFRDRFDEMEDRFNGQIDDLKKAQRKSTHRERLMYQHTRDLRNHIINELPPPPPAMPQELQDWFESFEDTESH